MKIIFFFAGYQTEQEVNRNLPSQTGTLAFRKSTGLIEPRRGKNFVIFSLPSGENCLQVQARLQIRKRGETASMGHTDLLQKTFAGHRNKVKQCTAISKRNHSL